MSRIIFLIDGFNLYHALDQRKEYRNYKWLNLAKLSRCFITDKSDLLEGVYYFTTLATWDPGKVERHRLFIRAQEANGVDVVYARSSARIDTALCAASIFELSRKSRLTLTSQSIYSGSQSPTRSTKQ